MHTRTLTNNKLSEIDVVILCGGMGTRLRSVVDDRPKPMAEINDRPFLDILIDSFAQFGLGRFILCAGYMSDIIRNYYANKDDFVGWGLPHHHVTGIPSTSAGQPLPANRGRDALDTGSPHHWRQFIISAEQEPLGTAGAIKNAAEHIQSDTFLVANGDSFCSADLNKFYDFHAARQALMSMVVIETENTGDRGMVSLDDSQRITGFDEKNQQAKSRYINAGIYLFRKEILSLIPENIAFSLERELFPKLIEQNCYAFPTRSRLFDIGTPERFAAAIKHLAKDHIQPS